jgi:hypothetical protein
MDCIDPEQLRFVGLFSSYTARFGRVGQLDYAIANEVLNKQARQFSTQYPNCRVASFNWGPWDGGMVQGGLKQLFASEGIGLILLSAGAELVVQELSQQESRPVEVLVMAANTSEAPTEPVSTRPDPRIQSDQPRAKSQSTTSSGPRPDDHSDQSTDFRVAFERELDVSRNRFLESHVLGGKAVLPVAMIYEWLAHAAIHRNPGLELRGIDNFKVYQGVRISKAECVLLSVLTGKTTREKDCFKVPTRLVGKVNGRETVHASGIVILGTGYPPAGAAERRPGVLPYPCDVSTAYARRLFHGQHFQGLVAIEGCSNQGIVVTSQSAPAPTAFMDEPARGTWLTDPMMIDVALQAVILWSQEQTGKPCLPCAVNNYRQFRRTFPRDPVCVSIRVQPGSDQLVRCDVEFVDQTGNLVARMEGCESVAEASLVSAFQRNRLE